MRALKQKLRALIFETAREIAGMGPLAQGLKWGEPSYTPQKAGIGSSVRIAERPGERMALLFICHTGLVERFRELYPDRLEFEGNRALIFAAGSKLPVTEIKHCIAMALTYHRAKVRI